MSASQDTHEGPRTFVLVHGAYHGGWCWREVADRLVQRGHKVFTPTLTGLGERSHLMREGLGWETFIADITQLIKYEELSDVVLVGHSFSGGTISGVADRIPSTLRHLVYFDAMILQSGQSALDTAPRELIEGYRMKAQEFSGGVSVPPNPPSYYGIERPDQVAKLARLMTPHPLHAYLDPLHLQNPVANGLPVTYVACSKPLLPSTASSRDYAKGRDDWRYVDFPHPHNAMMTAPAEVVALLEGINSDRSDRE